MMKEGGATPKERVRHGYRLATARLPQPLVAQILASAFQEELEHFKKSPDAAKNLLSVGDSPRDETLDAAEHAAWTIVASMLLNLDEVITRL